MTNSNSKTECPTKPHPFRKYARYGLWLVGCGLTWFLIHLALITWDGFTDELEKVDVAVIFGNKVHPNGRLSTRLKLRMDRAIALHKRGYFKYVIVSGGTGKEGVDEAKAMKRYLLQHKLLSTCILVDSKGINTYATARYTRNNMRRRKWRSAMVISQYFHISRAKLAFSRFGIKSVSGAHAIYKFEWREFYSLFREFFGYYAYLLKSYPA